MVWRAGWPQSRYGVRNHAQASPCVQTSIVRSGKSRLGRRFASGVNGFRKPARFRSRPLSATARMFSASARVISVRLSAVHRKPVLLRAVPSRFGRNVRPRHKEQMYKHSLRSPGRPYKVGLRSGRNPNVRKRLRPGHNACRSSHPGRSRRRAHSRNHNRRGIMTRDRQLCVLATIRRKIKTLGGSAELTPAGHSTRGRCRIRRGGSARTCRSGQTCRPRGGLESRIWTVRPGACGHSPFLPEHPSQPA